MRAPPTPTRRITVGGVQRTYALHVPDGLTGHVPLDTLVSRPRRHGRRPGTAHAHESAQRHVRLRHRLPGRHRSRLERRTAKRAPARRRRICKRAHRRTRTPLFDRLETCLRNRLLERRRVFELLGLQSRRSNCRHRRPFRERCPTNGVPACRPNARSPFCKSATADPIMPFDGGAIVLAPDVPRRRFHSRKTAHSAAKNAGCSDAVGVQRSRRCTSRTVPASRDCHTPAVIPVPTSSNTRSSAQRTHVAGGFPHCLPKPSSAREPSARRKRNHRAVFHGPSMK